MQYSLRNLFLIIAFLAVACAGMMYRTHRWEIALVTLTLVIYAAIALRAIVAQGRNRALLSGFCMIGFGYFLLVNCATHSVGRILPTSYLSASAAYLLKVRVNTGVPSYGIANPPLPTFDEYMAGVLIGLIDNPFYHICHCLWSLFFATLAAWLVGRMYDRRRTPSS
jgi:hypothetical protein